MYKSILILIIAAMVLSCKSEPSSNTTMVGREVGPISNVNIEFLHTDSTSIRAIAVTNTEVMYAGSNGQYGYYTTLDGGTRTGEVTKGSIDFLGKKLAFRSIASTKDAVFMLSIESPAVVYRYDKFSGEATIVYVEEHEKAFYDSMEFWNDNEGIAMGDPTEGCLSIIITRDGGASWQKLDCAVLPQAENGEAAFAASDTNIKIIGNKTWIISGGMKSRVFYSGDKGMSWQVYNTPIIQGTETQGAYSMDFYDENNGIIYGGDYTAPEGNQSNIAVTTDGGKIWTLTAVGKNQGYKSCVQYIPNSNGREIIASGFTGISYSRDAGASWSQISDGKFLTLRFVNDSIAYAGGSNVLARLHFIRADSDF